MRNFGFRMGLVFIVDAFKLRKMFFRRCRWRAPASSLWAFVTLATAKRWKERIEKGFLIFKGFEFVLWHMYSCHQFHSNNIYAFMFWLIICTVWLFSTNQKMYNIYAQFSAFLCKYWVYFFIYFILFHFILKSLKSHDLNGTYIMSDFKKITKGSDRLLALILNMCCRPMCPVCMG